MHWLSTRGPAREMVYRSSGEQSCCVVSKIIERLSYFSSLCSISLFPLPQHCLSNNVFLSFSFSAANCSSGFTHTECASPCQRTCQLRARNYVCPQRCIDGCTCADGMLLDGEKCVKEQQCPCEHHKKRYPAGAILSRDCNKWWATYSIMYVRHYFMYDSM